MAIITPSPLAQTISGRVGGIIFATHQSYTTAKTSPTLTTPTSKPFLTARAALQSIKRAWDILTPDQRRAWTTTAQNAPTTNHLGQTLYLTGYTLFTRANYLNILTNNPYRLQPPQNPTPLPPPTLTIHALTPGPITTTTSINGPWQSSRTTALYITPNPPTSSYATHRTPRLVTQTHTPWPTQNWATTLAQNNYIFQSGQLIALHIRLNHPTYLPSHIVHATCIVNDLPFLIADFESNNLLPGWTPAPSYSIQSTTTYTGKYALMSHIPSPGGQINILYSTQGLPIYPIQGHTFQFWTRTTNTQGHHGILFAVQNPTNYFRLRYVTPANILQVHHYAHPTFTLRLQHSIPWTPNTWFRTLITRRPTGHTTVSTYSSTGTLLASGSYTDLSYPNGTLACFHSADSGTTSTTYWDDFIITGPAT